MSVIYLLLAISIVVAVGFFIAFILAVKRGSMMIIIPLPSECYSKTNSLMRNQNHHLKPKKANYNYYGSTAVSLR